MGLFSNIREEILEEFEQYCSMNSTIYKIHEVKFDSNDTFNNRSSKISKPKDYSFLDKLELKRWACSPVCPFCDYEKYYILSIANAYRCANPDCRKGFNVLNKTILENTKVELSKWYDITNEFRNNKIISTHDTAKKHGLTQKTVWWMLAKIKTSPFIKEPDISTIHILLTPNPFKHKEYTTKKPSFKEFRESATQNLNKVYHNQHTPHQLLMQLLIILGTHYNGKQHLLAKDIGLSKQQLSRYLTGKRKLSKKTIPVISDFINNKIKSGIDYINKIQAA